MYPGYLSLGQGNPFDGGTWTEIVNSGRAYAYALNSGMCWLEQCTACPETDTVAPGGGSYHNPVADPAPWYDPDNPDTWGFLGVVGLQVSGDKSSTRQATVSSAITGGGVIGPVYFGPRTLVLRALAIAEDECSLSAGLDWLRFASGQVSDPCQGDSLTFFDCCPCVCTDGSGPCWARFYYELKADPDLCTPDWWPGTYAELMEGPPTSSEDWCAWPATYRQLIDGPQAWACCAEDCVFPYLRQYHNVQMTAGPIVLRSPKLNSRGAFAEIEFTIVAADPSEYALAALTGVASVSGGVHVPGSGPASVGAAVAEYVDPFATPSTRPMRPRREAPAPAAGWVRSGFDSSRAIHGVLSSQRLSVKLRTFNERAERVRVGVWDDGQRVAGYSLAFVPANAQVTIDAARRTLLAEADGIVRELPAFVRGWDGGPPEFPDLPLGEYRVTVDQEADRPVRILVNAAATPVGAR